ncbi:MAG: F0F1 ATP synthase subunit A [Ruminococcaceae bacterium]|nr:F0F1 ATP synthase subunit A [Oscillospiraceae bacterium]
MDLSVTGAKIYFKIPFLFGTEIRITQTTISLLVVTIILITAAYFLGRNLKKRPGRLQVITEKGVTMLYGLVEETMGKHNLKFAPYIGALLLSSFAGSLIGTTQLFRSTTADLSVTLAWALVTSVMVWYSNIKNFGFVAWLKGFTEPVVVMTPMNIVSEIAQPISLAFRHFGNVAGGGVLTSLVYAALAALSNLLFGWLPGLLGSLPFMQAGIPAFLSIYFDLFSGFVQALVFSLLTMVYVGSANPPPEEIPERPKKKAKFNASDI